MGILQFHPNPEKNPGPIYFSVQKTLVDRIPPRILIGTQHFPHPAAP